MDMNKIKYINRRNDSQG